MRNALYNASAAYSRKDFIYDSEIRAYTVLNKEGASLLYEFAEAAEQFICDKLMFEKVENIDWDVQQTRKSTIDMAGLTLFMKELHPEWKIGSVDNDISVINKINILRKGDYSERFGGYKKLPIFVTTNSELVYSIREYAKKQVNDGRGAMWNLHALPVVSDNMVLFRLWAPVAQKCSNLPAITLSGYAYSAQNADERFFIELRRKSISYRSARGVDIINVSDSIRKKLEDIIITNTMGQVENISNQVMAASVEELIKLENEDLHIENRKLKYAEIEKSCRLEDKSRRVIELCASRYSNQLGLMRPLIWVAKYWWIIAAFILLILSMLFDTTLGWLAFALPVFAQMVLFCLGKYLSNESIEYWLLKPVIRLVIKKLSRRVKEGVSDSELDCVDDIISEVINNTRILKKYKRFWEGEGRCGIL